MAKSCNKGEEKPSDFKNNFHGLFAEPINSMSENRFTLDQGFDWTDS